MRTPSSALLVGSTGVFALVLAIGDAQAQSLPQLDFATYPPQLIWLALSFIVLYLLMSRSALPRIGSLLEERQDKIDDNLKRAETLRDEAAAAEKGYEDALATARSEAMDAIKTVRDAASAEAAKRQGELGDTLAARIKDAEAKIEASKTAAMADIKTLAADAAAAAAEKLSGAALSRGDVDAAVAKALEGETR